MGTHTHTYSDVLMLEDGRRSPATELAGQWCADCVSGLQVALGLLVLDPDDALRTKHAACRLNRVDYDLRAHPQESTPSFGKPLHP